MECKTLLIYCVLISIGAGAALCAMPGGIGLSPDATKYVSCAQAIANGDGVVYISAEGEKVPLTHWAPLLPATIAFFSLFGMSVLTSAAIINAVLLGINAVLLYTIVRRISPNMLWPSILAYALVITLPTSVYIHTMAWSEPLFVTLALSTILLLDRYIAGPSGIALIISALLCSAAVLTRYHGTELMDVCAIALLALLKTSVRSRMKAVCVFVLICCIPIGVWALHNVYVAGTAVDRAIGWHPFKPADTIVALDTMSRWYLPDTLPSDIRITWFLAACACAIICSVFLLKKRMSVLLVLCWLQIVVFVSSLVVSITFLDGNTPMSLRILSPALFFSIAIVTSSMGVVVEHARLVSKKSAVCLVTCLMLLACGSIAYGIRWIVDSRREAIAANGERLRYYHNWATGVRKPLHSREFTFTGNGINIEPRSATRATE